MYFRRPSPDLFKSKIEPMNVTADVTLRRENIELNLYFRAAPWKHHEARLQMTEKETEAIRDQLNEALGKMVEKRIRAEAQARCDAGEASDADRVLLARQVGRFMLGPEEREKCSDHPDEDKVVRWDWEAPADGDHDAAIEASEPELVRDCPRCAAESEAA